MHRDRRAAARQRALELAAKASTWGLVLVLVLTLAGRAGGGLETDGAGAGAPLYPDLRTVPPSDLYFDQLGDGTHILRFANTAHREVASDTVYHPGHQHYHFANLASYTLLHKQKRGGYEPTTKQGTKTSYCLIDTDHFERDFASM